MSVLLVLMRRRRRLLRSLRCGRLLRPGHRLSVQALHMRLHVGTGLAFAHVLAEFAAPDALRSEPFGALLNELEQHARCCAIAA